MGDWLSTYGPSIYGTRGGPISPRDWGATTRRGDTVYVHVLNWPDKLLALPDFGARVASAIMLAGGAKVDFVQTTGGVTLTLPSAATTEIDRVIVRQTRAPQ